MKHSMLPLVTTRTAQWERVFASDVPALDGEAPAVATATAAIVLAGSHYWGSGTFERTLRGPLLPVGQQPLISYPLRWIAAAGIGSATVCAGPATDAVRARFGATGAAGVALDYYVDETPRGPAGCARDAALATTAERFVLVDGSLLPTLDLRALLAAHIESEAVATTVVEIDRRRMAIGGERPATPGGVYIFERDVLESVPALGFQDIKQGLLERLYSLGVKVVVREVPGVSPRILDFATYASVNSWVISTASDRGEPFGAWRRLGEALVHPTARVHPRARLIGPMLIGPDAQVDEGAVLVGPLSLGAGSHVEADAVLTRSVTWERCSIGAGAIVDACLLGDGAAVAPGESASGAVIVDERDAFDASLSLPSTSATGSERGDALFGIPSLGALGS